MTAGTANSAYPRPVMTAHVEGMTDVERLLAIEEIKQLKARYFRCMDTKDWDGFEAVFAPDVEFDLRQGVVARDPETGEIRRSGKIQFSEDQIRDEDWKMTGARAVRDWESGILQQWTTIHQGHCPEIEIVTPTTATGIWHMEDRLRVPIKNAYADMFWLPEPTEAHELHAFGVYHETYERIDGRWLIKSLVLKRIRVDIV